MQSEPKIGPFLKMCRVDCKVGELCIITKFERLSQINWYFQRSMVSFNVCKECLNVLVIQDTGLTSDRELNIFVYRTPFLCHYMQGLQTFRTGPNFWFTL